MSQTHPRPMVPSFKPPSLSHCPGQAELEQISTTGEWLICRHTQSYLLKGIKANALGNGKNKEQEIWKKGETIQVSWILQSLCAWPCYHRKATQALGEGCGWAESRNEDELSYRREQRHTTTTGICFPSERGDLWRAIPLWLTGDAPAYLREAAVDRWGTWLSKWVTAVLGDKALVQVRFC